MDRVIAIGDIHGCNDKLQRILNAISPQENDTIITLGDYIDRGEQSKDVIQTLIDLQENCNLISLIGNHELMLMRALCDKNELKYWLKFGGIETLISYGWNKQYIQIENLKNIIPYEHIQFITNCKPYYETDENIFVHANYDSDVDMSNQTEEYSFWKFLDPLSPPQPHKSGKTVWVGHSSQSNGKILDLDHVVCIDTNDVNDEEKCITGINVKSRKIYH